MQGRGNPGGGAGSSDHLCCWSCCLVLAPAAVGTPAAAGGRKAGTEKKGAIDGTIYGSIWEAPIAPGAHAGDPG